MIFSALLLLPIDIIIACMNEELPDPTCADCKAFYMEARDENGTIRGLCRLRSELGEVPATMPYCHVFRIRDSKKGVVKDVSPTSISRRGTGPGTRRGVAASSHIDRPTLKDPVVGDTSGEFTMDRDGLKQVLRELLEEETLYGYPELGAKWQDGTLVIKPADADNQPKEVPIDVFFNKIIMLRDRLRVLEAKINSHDKLEKQEKIELQGYISKCYGTLTTFNVLFRDKADHFSSK